MFSTFPTPLPDWINPSQHIVTRRTSSHLSASLLPVFSTRPIVLCI
jgi:hypothetical protein